MAMRDALPSMSPADSRVNFPDKSPPTSATKTRAAEARTPPPSHSPASTLYVSGELGRSTEPGGSLLLGGRQTDRGSDTRCATSRWCMICWWCGEAVMRRVSSAA